jgi:chaperone BCS1
MSLDRFRPSHLRSLSFLPQFGSLIQEWSTYFKEIFGIGGNDFASGGLALGMIGGVIAIAKTAGDYFIEWLQRKFIVVATFNNTDESYQWLLSYLADHPMATSTSRFTIATDLSGKPGQNRTDEDSGYGIYLPRVFFIPSAGRHFFWFKNRLLWLSKEQAQRQAGQASSGPGLPSEVIKIASFGRSRSVLEDLIQEAQRKFVEKEKGRTVIYASDGYGNWRRTRSRPVRPLDTIVLDRGLKSWILSDVIEFLGSEKWYADRGIPYRRGYLLYGYPGTGKTSFITSLAGELRLNIYVISLANKMLTDESLIELMSQTPPRCILLLEDIDAAFVSRTMTQDGSAAASAVSGGTPSTGVTFSGLLNAIDGVAAQEGRILCMTTNHIEKLDPALIRPGRIDCQVLLDRGTQAQAHELFLKFYSHGTYDHDLIAEEAAKTEDGVGVAERIFQGVKLKRQDTMAEQEALMKKQVKKQPTKIGMVPTQQNLEEYARQFSEQIPEKQFSMAQLQGYLMRFKYDPRAAVANVGALLSVANSGNDMAGLSRPLSFDASQPVNTSKLIKDATDAE